MAGRVRRLETEVVPQMGWNDVETNTDPLIRQDVARVANGSRCEA